MDQSAPGPAATPSERRLPGAFSLFTPSVDALKFNLGTFIGLFLSPIALVAVLYVAAFIGSFALTRGSEISGPAEGVFGIFVLLMGLALMVVSLIISAAFIYTALASVKGETVEFGDSLRIGTRYTWKYFLLSLLAGLIIFVGFLLFIVPGFFMMKRYLLAPYYLVDKNTGVWEAMKLSAAAAKQFSGAVWGVVGVQLLVGLSCAIPIVGLVLSSLYFCAPAVRYIQIKEAMGIRVA